MCASGVNRKLKNLVLKDCTYSQNTYNSYQRAVFVATQFLTSLIAKLYNKKSTTRMGFEPTRAEPNGLAVHRLNHSATSSDAYIIYTHIKIASNITVFGNTCDKLFYSYCLYYSYFLPHFLYNLYSIRAAILDDIHCIHDLVSYCTCTM